MPTIRITVKGILGEISAESFLTVISKSLDILKDLDHRISEHIHLSTRWVISGLGPGSTYVELKSKQVKGREDYPQKIADSFASGMRMIQMEGKTPPLFSSDNVEDLLAIVRGCARNGARGVEYSLVGEEATADFTTEDEPKIAKIIGVAYKAIGSIEGKVEAVSVRRRSKHFSITHIRTQKAIRCNLTNDLEEDVIKALHDRRRVLVTGIISYNEKGEPVNIHVRQPIRFLKKEEELPTIRELAGSDKEITGGMTSEEYLRNLNDG